MITKGEVLAGVEAGEPVGGERMERVIGYEISIMKLPENCLKEKEEGWRTRRV
jgi:hypothetical protein